MIPFSEAIGFHCRRGWWFYDNGRSSVIWTCTTSESMAPRSSFRNIGLKCLKTHAIQDVILKEIRYLLGRTKSIERTHNVINETGSTFNSSKGSLCIVCNEYRHRGAKFKQCRSVSQRMVTQRPCPLATEFCSWYNAQWPRQPSVFPH
jgi:hypothetical protein